MAIYLFSQILKFTLYSIKLIEQLSRRHLIISSDVFVIKGFTVKINPFTPLHLILFPPNLDPFKGNVVFISSDPPFKK